MKTLPTFFTLMVQRIVILRFAGTDQINLTIPELDSPYPELSKKDPGHFPTSLSQECRRGYAETWLSNVGFSGCKAELITYTGSQDIVIP
jgi:hypothetical protein